MPQYSEVIYNPTAAWVAQANADTTFGTPVNVDYIQQVTFEYESDTDEIKSAGQFVESLAVPTKATGELSQASLDFPGMSVITGYGNTNFGATPNQYGIMNILTGGAGLPYFGMIVAYASTNGGNLLVGFPKMKLETVPGFTVDQNTFRIGTANFNAYAPSVVIRQVVRYRKYETAAQIPQTAQDFEDFFKLPTNMFDEVA